MSQAGNCICRDEFCEVVEVHPAHPVKKPRKERAPAPGRELWKRSSPKALDHAIAKATSKYRPTHFSEILREVENDYGRAETPHALERAVYRHLKKLVERGQILKLDLGLSFAAYIRPKSRLLNDLGLMREQMADQIRTTNDDEPTERRDWADVAQKLVENDGKVWRTANALNMSRKQLQRMIKRNAPTEQQQAAA